MNIEVTYQLDGQRRPRSITGRVLERPRLGDGSDHTDYVLDLRPLAGTTRIPRSAVLHVRQTADGVRLPKVVR